MREVLPETTVGPRKKRLQGVFEVCELLPTVIFTG
jgi:hypothetical protein